MYYVITFHSLNYKPRTFLYPISNTVLGITNGYFNVTTLETLGSFKPFSAEYKFYAFLRDSGTTITNAFDYHKLDIVYV